MRAVPGSMVVAVVVAASLLGVVGAPLVLAQAVPVATARYASGTLLVLHPDGVEDRLQGKGVVSVFDNDLLRTGTGSQGVVDFREGIQLALNENTAVRILSRWEKAKGITRILRVSRGEIWIKVNPGAREVDLEMPTAMVPMREGEVSLRVREDGESNVTLVQGSAAVATVFGACSMTPSTITRIVRGKACTTPVAVDLRPVQAWSRPLLQR